MPHIQQTTRSRATATAPYHQHVKRVGLALLFCTLWPSLAWGQITVPAESKEHTPIPVTLKAMVPEGATIQSGAGLVWPEGVNKLEVGPGQWVVCAPPGEYTITYKVRWLHIVPITFKDFDGKEVTFQNYLGSGDIDEKATFKVIGEVKPDPPNPPDPPTPGGPYQVMLFYEWGQLDNLPSRQQELLTSLTVRDSIAQQGHVFLAAYDRSFVDSGKPADKAAWFRAVAGKDFPVVALAPKDGGTIQVYPLPADQKGLLDLLSTKDK